MLKFIFNYICLMKYRLHRAINPVSAARKIGVRVGKDCRLINVEFGSEPYLISIGDHVSATKTQFITHDGGVWIFRDKHPNIDLVAPIHVGSNVFLGYGVVILPGVKIGNNVIIGAGAVVTKNIPDNSIAVGVPARVIKTTSEYWENIKNRVVHTKQMSEFEKKCFYKKHIDLT